MPNNQNNRNNQSTQSVGKIQVQQQSVKSGGGGTLELKHKPQNAPQDPQNNSNNQSQADNQEKGLKSFLRRQEVTIKRFIRETGENIEKSFQR